MRGVGDAARALRHASARRAAAARPSTTRSAASRSPRCSARRSPSIAPGNPDPEWRRVFLPGGRAAGARASCSCSPTWRARCATSPPRGPTCSTAAASRGPSPSGMEADGFLTLDDLGAHAGEWGEPISTTYRGVHGLRDAAADAGAGRAPRAEHAGGRSRSRASRVHSVEHLHLLLEVDEARLRRPRPLDRRSGARPRPRRPALLDKAYAAERRRRLRSRARRRRTRPAIREGDTTGFVVADGHGNVLSVIQSLFNSFGSGRGPAGHRRRAPEPRAPLQPGPGASRAVLRAAQAPVPHAAWPRIATRDDRPVLGFATMGGNGQAMFHVQVLTNMLDYGMDIQEAIERPRFLVGAFLPDDPADVIHLEGRVPRRVLRRASRRRGHRHQGRRPSSSTGWATPTAIALRDGMLMRRRRSARRRRRAGLLMRAASSLAALVALVVLALTTPVGAAEWGLIRPGETTTAAVRARVRRAHAGRPPEGRRLRHRELGLRGRPRRRPGSSG